MSDKISVEVLIGRTESAQKSQRILYDLVSHLRKDPDLTDQIAQVIKCDPIDSLHKAELDLSDYERILQNVIHTTQIPWPPEAIQN